MLTDEELATTSPPDLKTMLDNFRADYALMLSANPEDWKRWEQYFGTNAAHVGTLVFAMESEIQLLRAELAATPPTLEWLRSVLGEPTRVRGGSTEWQSADDDYWVMYHYDGNVSVLNHLGRTFDFAPTRASVHAAVGKQP